MPNLWHKLVIKTQLCFNRGKLTCLLTCRKNSFRQINYIRMNFLTHSCIVFSDRRIRISKHNSRLPTQRELWHVLTLRSPYNFKEPYQRHGWGHIHREMRYNLIILEGNLGQIRILKRGLHSGTESFTIFRLAYS